MFRQVFIGMALMVLSPTARGLGGAPVFSGCFAISSAALGPVECREAMAKLLLASLGEIRRPRAEIRKKPESRRPDWLACGGGVGFQVSGFGFLSDFGPRISGFAIDSSVVSFKSVTVTV